MCMACEQEFMYQAYLNYLASKAAQGNGALSPEEKAFLEASGFVSDPAPEATGFACDPVPEPDAEGTGNPLSLMRPKAS